MLLILSKAVTNLVVLLLGIFYINNSKKDIGSALYPKWLGIAELLVGIATCIASFSVWFIS